MSDFYHFTSHTLQEMALVIMALVYTTRLIWLHRFPAGKERQAPTGGGSTTSKKGILYSWANVGMPWAMESFRTKKFLYAQFVVFHLAVTVAIAESFVIPYFPHWLEQSPLLVTIIQVVTAAGCLVGVMRMIRRYGNKYMRAISSPDDHFSLLLLTVWFAFACLAAPNAYPAQATVLNTYFILTAFFLIYVPFSKISHYLYYPFTRYFLGKTWTRRGVYPA
ncbi:MAG: hypothetical protein ABIE70_03240 [bacterium]